MTIAGTDPWSYVLGSWADPPEDAWKPLPHQVPPRDLEFFVWLLLAGRGAGKTDACANHLDKHMNGPPCIPAMSGGHRAAIIAPTLGDAMDACVNGPSGLKAHNPAVKATGGIGGAHVRWPNGAEAKLFGAHTPDDIERLRAGGNRCVVWAEELAAWRYLKETWEQMTFGLRLGKHPYVMASTTPKNRPLIRSLMTDPLVRVTTASTNDNPHLDERVRKALFAAYGDTRIGRQELYAELLEDVEGALWTAEMIEHDAGHVAKADLPVMSRIVVAVDPSWGTKGDECGIVVAGLGRDGRGYVLADLSLRAPPAQWGAAVAGAYHEWEADRIVAEVNFGAEQVRMVMRTVDPSLSFKEVRASRGKQQRAEPVVALYEQRKVSHLGYLGLLEQQMLTWVPNESDFSPDRVDALVWALSELMLDKGAGEPAAPIEVPQDNAWDLDSADVGGWDIGSYGGYDAGGYGR